jgi:hypothetical protein
VGEVGERLDLTVARFVYDDARRTLQAG